MLDQVGSKTYDDLFLPSPQNKHELCCYHWSCPRTRCWNWLQRVIITSTRLFSSWIILVYYSIEPQRMTLWICFCKPFFWCIGFVEKGPHFFGLKGVNIQEPPSKSHIVLGCFGISSWGSTNNHRMFHPRQWGKTLRFTFWVGSTWQPSVLPKGWVSTRCGQSITIFFISDKTVSEHVWIQRCNHVGMTNPFWGI